MIQCKLSWDKIYRYYIYLWLFMMSIFYWNNHLIKYSTIRIHIEVDCIQKVLNDASFNNHLCSIISYRVNHIYKDHNRKVELVPYFFILLWHSSYISYGHSHRLLLGLPTTDFIIRLNNYFIFPFNFNYIHHFAKRLKC